MRGYLWLLRYNEYGSLIDLLAVLPDNGRGFSSITLCSFITLQYGRTIK